MSDELNVVFDGGYGGMGNMSKHILFKYVLSENDSESYRKLLEKNDKKAYLEYLEYEEALEEEREI